MNPWLDLWILWSRFLNWVLEFVAKLFRVLWGFFFFLIEKGVRDGNFTTDGVGKLREVVKEKLMEFTDFSNDHLVV